MKEELEEKLKNHSEAGNKIVEMLRLNFLPTDEYGLTEIYPLSYSQFSQVDCRQTECFWHAGVGVCENKSPALVVDGEHSYCKTKVGKDHKYEFQPQDI